MAKSTQPVPRPSNTIAGLLELGDAGTKRQRLTVLKRCLESFNELNAPLHFIDTIEREMICDEFEAIAHACGVGRHRELADVWRDW